MKKHVYLSILSLLFTALVSASAVAQMVVTQPTIKSPIPGRTTTAAYMYVDNTGAEAVAIINARSELASSIEIHQIVTNDGVTGMRHQPQVSIPAGGRVAFQTGGLHLMVFGVTQRLGDSVAIELCFDNGETQRVNFKTEAW